MVFKVNLNSQFTYLFWGIFVTPEGFVAMVTNEWKTFRRQNLFKVGPRAS